MINFDRASLKYMAQANLRGKPTEWLVFHFQHLQDELQKVKDYEHLTPDDPYVYYGLCGLDALVNEVQRRRRLSYAGITNTNRETIEAIKSSLKIEDILEWYTEVFLHQRNWTYRCTLHGPDNHPSGSIKDNRAHCFVCDQGGDVFDVVQLFERVSLPQAIAKLARHIGVNLKPLKDSPSPWGGEGWGGGRGRRRPDGWSHERNDHF